MKMEQSLMAEDMQRMQEVFDPVSCHQCPWELPLTAALLPLPCSPWRLPV